MYLQINTSPGCLHFSIPDTKETEMALVAVSARADGTVAFSKFEYSCDVYVHRNGKTSCIKLDGTLNRFALSTKDDTLLVYLDHMVYYYHLNAIEGSDGKSELRAHFREPGQGIHPMILSNNIQVWLTTNRIRWTHKYFRNQIVLMPSLMARPSVIDTLVNRQRSLCANIRKNRYLWLVSIQSDEQLSASAEDELLEWNLRLVCHDLCDTLPRKTYILRIEGAHFFSGVDRVLVLEDLVLIHSKKRHWTSHRLCDGRQQSHCNVPNDLCVIDKPSDIQITRRNAILALNDADMTVSQVVVRDKLVLDLLGHMNSVCGKRAVYNPHPLRDVLLYSGLVTIQ